MTDDEQKIIRGSMSKMPFAAGLQPPHGEKLTAVDVAAWMSKLATKLHEHSVVANDNAQRLQDLTADVAAFRRVLGIVQPSTRSIPSTELKNP